MKIWTLFCLVLIYARVNAALPLDREETPSYPSKITREDFGLLDTLHLSCSSTILEYLQHYGSRLSNEGLIMALNQWQTEWFESLDSDDVHKERVVTVENAIIAMLRQRSVLPRLH